TPLIGPASSTGSPITFMMRPSVPGPTGTEIGRPVSVTFWPRTRPSLESMATVRTVDPPRGWATSGTRRGARVAGFSPLRRAGVEGGGEVMLGMDVGRRAGDLGNASDRLSHGLVPAKFSC